MSRKPWLAGPRFAGYLPEPMSDTQAPGAVIVIFGAAVRPDGRPSTALRRRVFAAARFGAALRAPLYLPTGARGRHGPPEATVMAALLRRLGVAPERIIEECDGIDTLSSVRAVHALLRAHGIIAPVYAATSAYHLPRCVLLLRLAGLHARACPPHRAPAAQRLGQRWYWRLRELPAIPYDAALLVALRLTGRV
jgi:uncharacterized SAM-binding protein YcdF (DUF218 family)